MKIVLADSNQRVMTVALQDPRIKNPMLLSYYYVKRANEVIRWKRDKRIRRTIYLDSGVFTARKQGKIITTDELIDFTLSNHDVFNYVFGNDEGSVSHQVRETTRMAGAGCKVLPIYHAAMPLSVLTEYATISDYIAVGGYWVGGAKASNPLLAPFLDRVFEHLHSVGRWPTKIHFLGCEDPNVLMRWPFYSADASSFSKNYSYSTPVLWDPVRFRLRNGEVARQPSGNRVLDMMPEAAPHFVRQGNAASYMRRAVTAALARTHMQDSLTRYWASKGVTWND